VREKYPAVFAGAAIERVFEAECAIIDWIAGEVEVAEPAERPKAQK